MWLRAKAGGLAAVGVGGLTLALASGSSLLDRFPRFKDAVFVGSLCVVVVSVVALGYIALQALAARRRVAPSGPITLSVERARRWRRLWRQRHLRPALERDSQAWERFYLAAKEMHKAALWRETDDALWSSFLSALGRARELQQSLAPDVAVEAQSHLAPFVDLSEGRTNVQEASGSASGFPRWLRKWSIHYQRRREELGIEPTLTLGDVPQGAVGKTLARDGALPSKLEIEFATEETNSHILFVPCEDGRTLMTVWICRLVVTNHDDKQTTITKAWVEIPGVAMTPEPTLGVEMRLLGMVDAEGVSIPSRRRANLYVRCAASFEGRIAYGAADDRCLLCLSAVGLGVYCTLVPASILVPREDR